MRTGDGLVAYGEYLPRRCDTTQSRGEILRVLGTVCVGYADYLFLGVFNVVFVHLDKRFYRSASAALLFDADYLPLLVTLEHRLYLQHRTGQRNGV